ncbi:hypothetical protein [Nitratifractor sp.]
MEQRFNDLHREAGDESLDPVAVVRRIERAKGIAWSMALIDALISTLEDEAEEEKRQKEIEKEYDNG